MGLRGDETTSEMEVGSIQKYVIMSQECSRSNLDPCLKNISLFSRIFSMEKGACQAVIPDLGEVA